MATAFPTKTTYNVAITGAAGQIGYSLAPMIASGGMLGKQQRLRLTLIDLPFAVNPLSGLAMELQDCNYPLLDEVVTSVDQDTAFQGVDVLIMCGAFPRKDGMERKDLLLKNADIFKRQGVLLRQHAPAHCRVLVVGNPANTNALLLSSAAWDAASSSGVHPTQITALTRLDQNRAAAEAKRFLGLPTDGAETNAVRNVIIWGNHSATQVPDVFSAAQVVSTNVAAGQKSAGQKLAALIAERGADTVAHFGGAPAAGGGAAASAGAAAAAPPAQDAAQPTQDFIEFVQKRGASVIKTRGSSSAASAANAIVDHMRDWICGTPRDAPQGEFVSMAVCSDGNPYGFQGGLVFSFPCRCPGQGVWEIVGGLEIADSLKPKIEATTRELMEEKEQATAVPTE